MKLNRRLTGGLAWGGLILIFAVPSADIIAARMAPGQGAGGVVDTTETASISTPDPVEKFLTTGKPLPSYISGGDEAAAPARVIVPATGVTLPAVPKAATQPVAETAALPPTAPNPMPASMRPHQAVVAEQPLVLNEDEVLSREAAIAPVVVKPRAVEPRVVTEDDLEDWDSGSLADYLERRGLISDAAYEEDVAGDYDEDGFFLSDGPNSDRRLPPRNVGDGDVFFIE